MSHLTSSVFLNSSLPVGANAVKNILFRAATIVLHFVVYKTFSFWAYKNADYTSFLMFGEDIVQKTLFAISRRLNRQAALVVIFAVVMAAAGFYDTLLWGLDFPGYVVKVKRTNAGLLSSQIIDSPAYVVFISNPTKGDLDNININNTIGANLFATGANYTLPGINAPGFQQVVQVGIPISPLVAPSIWLESDGFAVGLDEGIMRVATNSTANFCAPSNSLQTPDQLQSWRCPIKNDDALAYFNQNIARAQVWWDSNTPEYLAPVRKDNPWQSLGTGGDTAFMEQVFTVTRGTHRHTFQQTTLKATMISRAPVLLDDGEITDFMRRLWSDDPAQPITPAVQTLADIVIGAKNNRTSVTFGSFIKTGNVTVSSVSTELLNVNNGVSEDVLYTALRFVSNTITLIRSEVLFSPPKPYAVCDTAYSNVATGGVARSSNCYNFIVTGNNTASRFLGQIDTSSVVIMSDILGQGTQNISQLAITDDALQWYRKNSDSIDRLLLSRAYILGGVRANVQVDVRTTVAALSYLQLLLTLLPIALALLVSAATFQKPMSYYNNSLLSALCTTTHTTNDGKSCLKAGYLHAPPDIFLKSNGEHMVLGTSNGGIIANVVGGPGPGPGSPVYGYGYGGPGLSYRPVMTREETEDSGKGQPAIIKEA